MYMQIPPDRDHLPWSDMMPNNPFLAASGGGGCDGDGSCGDGQSGGVGCGH